MYLVNKYLLSTLSNANVASVSTSDLLPKSPRRVVRVHFVRWFEIKTREYIYIIYYKTIIFMNPLIPFACISSSVGAIPGMRVSALGVHRLPSTVAGVEVTWWRRDWHFWGYWTAAIKCKSGEKVSVYVCPWHEYTTLFVRPKETFLFLVRPYLIITTELAR